MKKRNSISKNKNKSNKNLRNNNLYQSTESIIKIIIDKLINLSVRKSYSNKIDSQIGDYCFKFMKNNINNIFELNYIAHTKESKKTNISNNKNAELFWALQKPPTNTWVEILEPDFFEIDRYEGTNINYKELNEKKEEKNTDLNKNDIQNNSNTKNIIQKSYYIQYKLNNTNLPKISSKSVINDFIEKKESNKNIILQKTLLNTRNDYKKETNISENNNNTQNKNKKNQIIEFPSDDISNLSEDIQKYDLPNVENLRKEVEKNILKKEEEKKKLKKEEEKEKLLQKITIDKKNKKLFDSNRLTFDSDGKIISFKRYNIDNLKDFILTKNFIKEVKKNINTNLSKKSLPNINNSNITSKTPIKTINIKEKEKGKEKEKEKEKENEKEIIRQSQRQINKINDRLIEKIIPSGSNFQLMSPVIGVVIKENGQSKEGPKDFSKYFKKYSLKDYDNMLSNYLPNMNKKFLKTSFDNMSNRQVLRNNVLNMNNLIQSNLNKKKSNDINNNNINNDELSVYNPLISSPNKDINLMEKDINNLLNYKTIDVPNNHMISTRKSFLNNSKNNPLLTSYNNISSNMNKNNLYTTNFDNFITMKKMGMGSLKLELDSLKNLDENSSTLYKNSLTTRYNDIIGNQFKAKNKSLNSRNINNKNVLGDFNKKILTSSRWGNEFNDSHSKNVGTVYSKHQTKIQVLRELGSNILEGIKIKLPRNRKVNLSVK